MLKLGKISRVLSGVSVKEAGDGCVRIMRLTDLSELKAGRIPKLAMGEAPTVARALAIGDNDLIIGARGATTDVCVADNAIIGAFISLDLYLLRPDRDAVHPHYLAAFLELPSTQAFFTAGKQGTKLARLSKDALESVQVPIPPMQTQQLIAALAQTFKIEAALLTRLADLNATLGREAVTRAFHAAEVRPAFTRSAS